MKYLKRFSLRSVSDFLSEQEMKRVTGGYDPDPGGGYEGSEGSHSLKCFNSVTSCFVEKCPDNVDDAKALCKQSSCGGSYGSFISCT